MSIKPKLTTGEEANRFIEKVREKYLSKGDVFPLQDKTVTENGEVKADENYYGLNKVTVNVQPEPLVLEPTTVVSTGTEKIINPPSGVAGFSRVTVNPIDLENKTITKNGVYTSETKSGFGEVTVDVKEDINLTYKQRTELFPDDFAALENFTRVPDYCFYQDTNLQYIELPDSVTEIGQYAFSHCNNLISVVGENVSTIRKCSFRDLISYNINGYNYTCLNSINFPNVKVIEEQAFGSSQSEYYNSSLIKLELPEVLTIGNDAFKRFNRLITVNLPNVKTIGKGTFLYCSSLRDIYIPNVESIDEFGFANCNIQSDINLPKVTTIGNSAFRANKFTIIDLPLIQRIGDDAFSQCNNLKNINIPNVKHIGGYAFGWIYNGFTNISLPSSLISIGNMAFLQNYNLTNVTIGDTENGSALTSIAANAFTGCTALTEINIYAPKSQVTTAASAPWGATKATVNWQGGE